jgi:hypothetical protein
MSTTTTDPLATIASVQQTIYDNWNKTSQNDRDLVISNLLTLAGNLEQLARNPNATPEQTALYERYRSEIVAQLLELQNRMSSSITSFSTDIQNSIKQLKEYQNSIQFAQSNIIDQQNENEEKKKILDTRNRMLQISREKNLYKRKMIYTLLSVILILILILFVLYISFQTSPAAAVKNAMSNVRP